MNTDSGEGERLLRGSALFPFCPLRPPALARPHPERLLPAAPTKSISSRLGEGASSRIPGTLVPLSLVRKGSVPGVSAYHLGVGPEELSGSLYPDTQGIRHQVLPIYCPHPMSQLLYLQSGAGHALASGLQASTLGDGRSWTLGCREYIRDLGGGSGQTQSGEQANGGWRAW